VFVGIVAPSICKVSVLPLANLIAPAPAAPGNCSSSVPPPDSVLPPVNVLVALSLTVPAPIATLPAPAWPPVPPDPLMSAMTPLIVSTCPEPGAKVMDWVPSMKMPLPNAEPAVPDVPAPLPSVPVGTPPAPPATVRAARDPVLLRVRTPPD
jgi:hypothetical protein